MASPGEAGDIWSCRMPPPASSKTKEAIRAKISRETPEKYFDMSCHPITHEAEQEMEQASYIVTREDYGNSFWDSGNYYCARCGQRLYTSEAKFKGPCIWPSFREGVSEKSLSFRRVEDYNKYTCAVEELYCGQCHLFVGHRFEDGKEHGDDHPDAQWRHCVLTLSLIFKGQT